MTQRYSRHIPEEEKLLVSRIVELAIEYGRYGYRRITSILTQEGWKVNHKRVERIWRNEGLKVPQKQPKRGRLWLNDGSCVRLRPEYKDHVWSYDFVMDRTSDGKAFRMLTIMDEYSRECLSILVRRSITSDDVIDELYHLFLLRGTPEYIRSDNGPEFTAKKVREWLHTLEVKTLFIEPGSPWENGYIESFNGKLRDELLDREVFTTLLEAQVLVEGWRKEYNQVRPHSSLGYRPPAPEAFEPYLIPTLTLEVVQ
jgi:transposase InsO family protein